MGRRNDGEDERRWVEVMEGKGEGRRGDDYVEYVFCWNQIMRSSTLHVCDVCPPALCIYPPKPTVVYPVSWIPSHVLGFIPVTPFIPINPIIKPDPLHLSRLWSCATAHYTIYSIPGPYWL